MDADLYRLFENKFRGPESLISQRLSVYQPALQALPKDGSKATALDLGCGRGEWLELLREMGFRGIGVDLNASMLESAQRRNLDVIKGDALDILVQQGSNSVSIISAFHLIEHLPFEKIQRLIKEAFRALEPGGLLILETPNIENLNVGAHTFYLDPTHIRPVPPLLLEFLAETAGFSRFKILYLQESISTKITLRDVLMGASPDYALVAQKAGSPQRDRDLEQFLSAKFGVTMDDLANRFESELNERITIIENRLLGKEQEIARLTQQKADILASTSWRVTAPFRILGKKSAGLRFIVRHRLKILAILIIETGRRFLPAQAKRSMKYALKRTPWLSSKIRNLTSISAVEAYTVKSFDDLPVVKLLKAAQNSPHKSNVVFLTSSEELHNA